MRHELPPLSRWFVVVIALGTVGVIALLLSLLWEMRAALGPGGMP